MKKNIYYIYILIGLALSSCSNFLEESSQDLMIPKSVTDYKELFFGEVYSINNLEKRLLNIRKMKRLLISCI